MNKAILTERAKIDERKDNKRKFLESKSRQQDRFQKPRSFSYTAPRYQASMQYRTQSQVTGPQASNTQFRSQNTMKAPQSNASQVTTNNSNARVCFNCRETGHFIANCPNAKNKLATSAFSNTVNGPRPVLSGANRVPIRSSNNSQQMRQPECCTKNQSLLHAPKPKHILPSYTQSRSVSRNPVLRRCHMNSVGPCVDKRECPPMVENDEQVSIGIHVFWKGHLISRSPTISSPQF